MTIEYTPDVQELFIQFMISDPDLWTRSAAILQINFFHKKLQPVISLMQKHAEKYNGLPKQEQIEALTGFKIEKIENLLPSDKDWYLENIEAFCRQRALEQWLVRGPDLVSQGKHGELEKGIKDALLISLHKNLGTKYWDDPRERLMRLKDKNGQIKTGWKDFDDKLYGGFNFGELHIFAGASGSGKSLFLQNLTLNLALAGHNIVYMTLELAEELVSMRIDCMLTGIPSRMLFKKLDDVTAIVESNRKNSGKIIIKEIPQGSTVNDIKSYLKEIEIQEGYRPDILMIDYLDLLFPNDRRVDPSNLFIKDKFVSEELRGLARDGMGPGHKMLTVTASQLNRGATEELEHNQAHIAGGKSKIDTADGVYSIHTSKIMREKGIYQLQNLKTRNSAGTGDKVTLGYDQDTMRIMDYENDQDEANDIMEKIKNKVTTADIEDDSDLQAALPTPKRETKSSSRDILAIVREMKEQKESK